MKKILLLFMVAGLMLASLTTIVMAAPGGVTDSDDLKDLAKARRATAKYHDVDTALADGYVSTVACVEVPGLGGMGIHYVNFGLAADLTVDPLTPEILLYVPTAEGMKLVGVEYFVAYVGQPAPILFGQSMDGPMPGHEPGQPEHYDLHVWLWQGNPDGIFAEFNPNVSCS
jgi:hypothetical protein